MFSTIVICVLVNSMRIDVNKHSYDSGVSEDIMSCKDYIEVEKRKMLKIEQ